MRPFHLCLASQVLLQLSVLSRQTDGEVGRAELLESLQHRLLLFLHPLHHHCQNIEKPLPCRYRHQRLHPLRPLKLPTRSTGESRLPLELPHLPAPALHPDSPLLPTCLLHPLQLSGNVKAPQRALHPSGLCLSHRLCSVEPGKLLLLLQLQCHSQHGSSLPAATFAALENQHPPAGLLAYCPASRMVELNLRRHTLDLFLLPGSPEGPLRELQ